VAGFLQHFGFSVHSLSDVVREAAARQGREGTRDDLIAIGVSLREQGGPGALARAVLPRLTARSVVDSIRNPGEVQVLRSLPSFLLLGVDAPQALRFERSLRRGRVGDGATLEEFDAKERRENSTTEAGQQLLATFKLADVEVNNDGTLEELHNKVKDALAGVGLVL
jgi:dephospho-CoA kinase